MENQEFVKYVDNYSLQNKFRRFVWNLCYTFLIRPFSLPFFNKWRCFVLMIFGAKIAKGANIRASAHIWAPWNLEVGIMSCIGPHTIIYNPGCIRLGNKVVVSQYSYLCTATHDYTNKSNRLYWEPIVINDYAWIAARAYIGPGVCIGEGAIVGATASVYKDVEPWTIVGGNPAKFIKKRELK